MNLTLEPYGVVIAETSRDWENFVLILGHPLVEDGGLASGSCPAGDGVGLSSVYATPRATLTVLPGCRSAQRGNHRPASVGTDPSLWQ
jgi:hypothetical protein